MYVRTVGGDFECGTDWTLYPWVLYKQRPLYTYFIPHEIIHRHTVNDLFTPTPLTLCAQVNLLQLIEYNNIILGRFIGPNDSIKEHVVNTAICGAQLSGVNAKS